MMRHQSQRHTFQTSSICSFYHCQYTTIWGIWTWMKFQIFLRLLEMKEISSLLRYISANRSYNLRNLNLKWGPTVPQIVGYKWKFLTLHVFSARKSYKLWNLWFELKPESSSDWRLSEKIPQSVEFLSNEILQSEESIFQIDMN